MKRNGWMLSYVIVVLIFLLQGCAGISKDSDLRTTQDVAKRLMDREALKTSVELLGVTYDPKESKLITATQMHNWINENRIDIKKYPIRVQKAINDKSALALLIPKFTPVDNQKSVIRSYGIGGIFLPTFFDDIGGWWLAGGGDCDVKCEKCTGCSGPGHICTCSYVCCRTCDRLECWQCHPCANNP